MKTSAATLILNILMITLLGQSAGAKLPQKWIHASKNNNSLLNFSNLTSSANLTQTFSAPLKLSPQNINPTNTEDEESDNDNDEENNNDDQYKHDFAKMINAGYATINPSKDQKDDFGLSNSGAKKQKGPWFLHSIRTEFGIEATGDIGFLGYQGEAAFEFIWQRTPYSLKKLQKEYFPTAQKSKPKADAPKATLPVEENVLSLNSDMSTTEVVQKVNSLVLYVDQSKKIKNPEKFKTQLMDRVMTHQKAVQNLAYIPDSLPWKPTKYQLELYAKAGGEIFPAIVVGGVIRVQIEWEIKRKKTMRPHNSQLMASLQNIGSQLQQTLKENQEQQDSIYELSTVKLGLGITAEGDFEVVRFESSALGIVFLKPDPAAQKKNNSAFFAVTDMLPQINSISGVSKDQWNDGFATANDMAKDILAEATVSEKQKDIERPYRDFELKLIEIELTLSAGGEFLLPTVMGTAYMELIFEKKSAPKSAKGKV